MNLKTRNIFKEKRGVSDAITFIARKKMKRTKELLLINYLYFNNIYFLLEALIFANPYCLAD